jgi:hypothetical protein
MHCIQKGNFKREMIRLVFYSLSKETMTNRKSFIVLTPGLEVLHGVGLRVGELEHLEGESVRVAGDEDEDDAHEGHRRFFPTPLEPTRLNAVRLFFVGKLSPLL